MKSANIFSLKFQKLSIVFTTLLAGVALLPFILTSLSCRNADLSRGQAAEAIAAAPKYQDIQFLYLSQGEKPARQWSVNVTGDDETPAQALPRAIESYNDAFPAFALAVHLGLLEPQFQIEESTPPKKSLFGDAWEWHLKAGYKLTDKCRKLFADYNLPEANNPLPIARRGAPTVTGITKQGENEALVEYRYSYEPNELGKHLDPQSPEFASLPANLKNYLGGGANKDGNPHVKLTILQITAAQNGQAFFRKYDDGSWRLVQ